VQQVHLLLLRPVPAHRGASFLLCRDSVRRSPGCTPSCGKPHARGCKGCARTTALRSATCCEHTRAAHDCRAQCPGRRRARTGCRGRCHSAARAHAGVQRQPFGRTSAGGSRWARRRPASAPLAHAALERDVLPYTPTLPSCRACRRPTSTTLAHAALERDVLPYTPTPTRPAGTQAPRGRTPGARSPRARCPGRRPACTGR